MSLASFTLEKALDVDVVWRRLVSKWNLKESSWQMEIDGKTINKHINGGEKTTNGQKPASADMW